MPTEMHEALNNEVHEVYSEVHEPHDDLHEVESKVEQAFNESHGNVYEAQKAAAVAKRIVGETSAVRVEKKADFAIFDHSVSRLIGYQ